MEFSILPNDRTAAPVIDLGRRNSAGAWVGSIGHASMLSHIDEPSSQVLKDFIEDNSQKTVGQGRGGVIALSVNKTGIEVIFDKYDMKARIARPEHELEEYEIWASMFNGTILYKIVLKKDESEIQRYTKRGSELQKRTTLKFGAGSSVVEHY